MDKFLHSTYDYDSDEFLEVLDELPFWSAPFGIRLFDSIMIRKNIKALDIGFGAGFPLTELAMRLGDTCKVYGIDPWEAATKKAQRKIKIYGIENIEIITGVAENIPLPDNSIDLITSNNGMNNVADLDKTLSECSRIMKSGGQFVLTMNTNESMIEFYDIMSEVLSEKGLNKEIEDMHRHIYKMRKPVDEVCKKLNDNSFEVTNIVTDKFEYKFADGKSMFSYFLINSSFLGSWKKLVPQDKVEEIFKEIIKRIDSISERDGCFKLTIPFVVIDCKKA